MAFFQKRSISYYVGVYSNDPIIQRWSFRAALHAKPDQDVHPNPDERFPIPHDLREFILGNNKGASQGCDFLEIAGRSEVLLFYFKKAVVNILTGKIPEYTFRLSDVNHFINWIRDNTQDDYNHHVYHFLCDYSGCDYKRFNKNRHKLNQSLWLCHQYLKDCRELERLASVDENEEGYSPETQKRMYAELKKSGNQLLKNAVNCIKNHFILKPLPSLKST